MQTRGPELKLQNPYLKARWEGTGLWSQSWGSGYSQILGFMTSQSCSFDEMQTS